MTVDENRGLAVRVRTAEDRKKAMGQYDELRRSGRVARAVVIAELKDGSYQVLGQGMRPEQVAQAIHIAAGGLVAVMEKQQQPHQEAHEEPVRRGQHNLSNPLPPTIRTKPDGTYDAPPGESFISCGECNHPRWHVLHRDDGSLSRLQCTHCGNEVLVGADPFANPVGRA